MMMNIYIVRHAIAVAPGTAGYEDDSQRPLTKKGRRKMQRIVQGLRGLGLELDAILSSPYVRARDTARILASGFGIEEKLASSENLVPSGNFDELIDEINAVYDVGNLALVGHEPMLSGFISFLTTGTTSADIELKKGGVCWLAADDLHEERRAVLKWLLTPAILVQLSK